MGFNPRTRVGCEAFLQLVLLAHLVSIHAPVWGAKFAFGKAVELLKVSIHAPVWGAKYGTSRDATLSCFNPRTRVGCELTNNQKIILFY